MRTFAGDGMEEVDSTESACDDGPNLVSSTGDLHLSAATNMREHVTLAHLDEGELRIVAVSKVVWRLILERWIIDTYSSPHLPL